MPENSFRCPRILSDGPILVARNIVTSHYNIICSTFTKTVALSSQLGDKAPFPFVYHLVLCSSENFYALPQGSLLVCKSFMHNDDRIRSKLLVKSNGSNYKKRSIHRQTCFITCQLKAACKQTGRVQQLTHILSCPPN